MWENNTQTQRKIFQLCLGLTLKSGRGKASSASWVVCQLEVTASAPGLISLS